MVKSLPLSLWFTQGIQLLHRRKCTSWKTAFEHWTKSFLLLDFILPVFSHFKVNFLLWEWKEKGNVIKQYVNRTFSVGGWLHINSSQLLVKMLVYIFINQIHAVQLPTCCSFVTVMEVFILGSNYETLNLPGSQSIYLHPELYI